MKRRNVWIGGAGLFLAVALWIPEPPADVPAGASRRTIAANRASRRGDVWHLVVLGTSWCLTRPSHPPTIK